jgi:hypothetical protein
MLGRINETRARMEEDEEFRKKLTEGKPSGNPITLGPRLPPPDEWAELQIKGAQANADKWLKRTLNPKKNFKEEALKAAARYHDSMSKVLAENLWEGGMELVNESEALEVVREGGSAIYSSGVARRKKKIQRVVKELHADRLALAEEIDKMPVATDADREAKMIANVRGLKAIGKKRRGG